MTTYDKFSDIQNSVIFVNFYSFCSLISKTKIKNKKNGHCRNMK